MKQALAMTLLAAAPLCSLATEVRLDIEGLDTSRLKGATLMVAVFTEPSTWLTKPSIGQRFVLEPDAASGKVSVVLKDLPAGPLAISLFQDANANGRLDMNAIGMPTEPYGFSNNASGSFGPPRFEQAVLTPTAGQVLKVKLN